MTDGTLILNATWRLVYVPNPGGSRLAAWHIQNVDDDRAGAFFRVAHMTRDYIAAKCGPITPEAQAIVDALPARSDRDPNRPAPKYVRKRPAKPVDAAPAATVTKPPAPPINEPSPRIPLAPTAELTAAMKEARLELIRKAAAAARQSLPERISAQRRHHGRWAST